MTQPAQDIASEPLLLRDERDGVVTLTLNRPRQFNALSAELIAAMQDAFDMLAGDESCRVVVLAAAGKAFCAGHDLKQMRAHEEEAYFRELFMSSARVMESMRTIPQPVIARVHGIATAAGCQLVANCDLAVAGEDATFATNGIANGLFCSTPSVPLVRNVPRKQAFEMLFTGEFVDAAMALQYGLVNRVAPADKLDDVVGELSDQIKSMSRAAVTSGKRMFYEQMRLPLNDAYAYAAEVMARDMLTDDAAEGFDAFIEKRKPVWRDR